MVNTDSVLRRVHQSGNLIVDALLSVFYPDFFIDLPGTEAEPVDKYVAKMGQLSQPGIPYNYKLDNPVSIFYTTTVLSNLIDLGMTSHSLARQLQQWLLNRQENGWWTNPELKDHELPSWQRPDNLSVKILLTSMTAGVLARYDQAVNTSQSQQIVQALRKTLTTLQEVTTENGALMGMPQSTWLLTPAVAYVYGADSSKFLQHWSILDQFVPMTIEKASFFTVLTIARVLLFAGVSSHDPLLQRCISAILDLYHDPDGWYVDDTYQAASSLAALLVLDETR